MSERLTEAELARMRAEHIADSHGDCLTCPIWRREHEGVPVLCDAARLLAHFAPGPVPHLAGIEAGLFGPVCSEELPSAPRS